jgi:hypothetical protein
MFTEGGDRIGKRRPGAPLEPGRQRLFTCLEDPLKDHDETDYCKDGPYHSHCTPFTVSFRSIPVAGNPKPEPVVGRGGQ